VNFTREAPHQNMVIIIFSGILQINWGYIADHFISNQPNIISMVKRIVSKDTGLGFGICLMLIVHIFTHQIGQSNPDNFVPVISQLSTFTLITLIPLIVMGVWGSAFTMLSCMALTIKIKAMDPKDNKLFLQFITGRIFAGVLMISLFRLFHWLFNFKDADSIFKEVHGFTFNIASTALDSIAIVGVLVPTLVFLLRKVEKFRNVKVFTAIFVGLTFLCLSLSYFIIPWGREICTILDEKNLFFFEYWVSKLVYGRFKIVYTFSFGCMGAFIGYLVASDVNEKIYMRFILLFAGVCFVIFGIAVIVDYTFIFEYASMDTPFMVQFFNLGAQAIVFSLFVKYLDMGSAKRKAKVGKRTTWLRRYGIVSLTIFTLGSLLARGVYWVMEKIMGPSLEYVSGDLSNPRLAWNTFQIYFFILVVFLCWQGVLMLWEKVNFAFSMEWIIHYAAVLLRLKKKPNLYIAERLYNPGNLDSNLEIEQKELEILMTTLTK